MPVHRNTTLDPSHCITIKPLTIRPPVGIKLQAWSSTSASEPANEQVSQGSYHWRQQLSRENYWRPYEHVGKPLHPEQTKLPGSLTQVDESASDQVVIGAAILKSTGRSTCLPFNLLQSPKREDASALKKHLCHVRRLMSAVSRGKGYFHLLQKEEQELQEAQLMEQRRREEQRRTECQPPCYDSDGDTESLLRTALSAGGSWSSGGNVRRKKLPAARPFTPVHHSLTSLELSSVALEPLFRQLCCLNWLLEAVTLNPPGRTGPVSSCWDVTDPGRSRMTVKKLNKEKAVEMRWDQFILPPKPRRAQPRPPCLLPGRLLRKASVLSVASSSATTPTLRSLSSLAMGPDGAPPLGGAGASEESSLQIPGEPKDKPPPSEGGQKFNLLSQGVANDSCRPAQRSGDKIDSPPQRQLSAVSQFVKSKSCVLDEMRSSFRERAQELVLSLNDTLESKAKNRWDSGVLRFEALSHRALPLRRTRPVTVTTAPRTRSVAETVSRRCEDAVWLCRLIAGLSETAIRDRRVGRLLEKLSRFTDGRSLRARPPIFLRVLGGLQPWELCSPDLCVAIEIVREHVVQMTEEEYDSWLQSRVSAAAYSDRPERKLTRPDQSRTEGPPLQISAPTHLR